MSGHWRCKWHSGLSTGPKTAAGKANTIAALQRGRERWLAKMRAAKEAGLIKKLPCGREPRGSPRRSANKIVARAQLAAERMIAMTKRNPLPTLPATGAPKPWDQQSKAEKLATAADLALDIARQVLDEPVDLDDIKRSRLQLDAALGILSRAIQVNAAQVMQPPDDNSPGLEEILRRVKEAEAKRAAAASPQPLARPDAEAEGNKTVISPPQRRQLPNRRQSETHHLDVGNTRLSATVGFYPEGIPAELFLSGAKDGTDMSAILADASVAISIALQCGIPARSLAKSILRVPADLEGTRTKPASPIGAAVDLLSELDPRLP